MNSTLLQAIAALPAEERIDLVEAIWDGLVDADEAPGVTDAQREELDRRLGAMESGGAPNLSWDEVRSRLRGR